MGPKKVKMTSEMKMTSKMKITLKELPVIPFDDFSQWQPHHNYVKPEIISGIPTGNGIPHDKYDKWNWKWKQR